MEMTIGGQGVSGGHYFDVVNPATGDVYAQAPVCTAAQLDRAMDAASKAQLEWRKDEDFRRERLQELSAAVMDAAPELAEILANENGKTLDLGGVEAMSGAAWLDYYANVERPREVIRDDDGAHTEIVR